MTIVLRIPGLDFVYLAIGVGCRESVNNREGQTNSAPADKYNFELQEGVQRYPKRSL